MPALPGMPAMPTLPAALPRRNRADDPGAAASGLPQGALRPASPQAEARSQPTESQTLEDFDMFREAVSVDTERLENIWDLREQRYRCLQDCAGGDMSDALRAFAEHETEVVRQLRRTWATQDFDAICQLGVGAFGTVHLVREKKGGGVFALKQMSKCRYRRKNYRDRAYAERDLLGKARTQWFVELFATFQDNDNVFMLMEFVQGGELLKYLEERERLSEAETRFYMAELLMALDVVHQHGFVHRDVKPDNVMLTATGHLKLLDFGLCKAEAPTAEDLRALAPGSSRRSRLISKVGTPQYMSPEAFAGRATAASDVWALGVVTFECLYGGVPFHAGDKDGLEAIRITQELVRKHAQVFPKRLAKAKLKGYLTPEAERLLQAIICDESNRLRAEDIRREPFFSGIDFDNIHAAEPAIKPAIAGALDVSNFAVFARSTEFPSRRYTAPTDLEWANYEFDACATAIQSPELFKEVLRGCGV